MTTTVLFVHGTGVRKEAYDVSLELIKKNISSYAPNVDVKECFWGDKYGAWLQLGGKSVPTYNTSRGPAIDTELALWGTLLQDPLFELRLLANVQGRPISVPLGNIPPGQMLVLRLKHLSTAEPVLDSLKSLGLEEYWSKALDYVGGSDPFRKSLKTAISGQAEHRKVIARSLVASMMLSAEEAGFPSLTAPQRDELTKLLLNELGGDDRGIFSWVVNPFIGLASLIGTWELKRHRRALTDFAYPMSGDILIYQAKGERIRGFIQAQIDDAPGPLFLLAHSLGGIACVDLLILKSFSKVKGLITVGSQAPFLYEIDALTSLQFGQELPVHFPTWLNFYDLNDILSYVGGNVFPGRVQDIPVSSRQPFPASHSSYWNSEDMWQCVASFIKNA